MKDIDLFTTEYGVASLILKEIPYKGEAYIRLRETQRPLALLRECERFCRMCGADRIYAEGHCVLEAYPLHTVIYRMRGTAPEGETACLWPVTPENVKQWRDLYNEKMATVDNAATLTAYDERFILETGGAHFVHRAGKLLGIGWLSGCELLALAGAEPGAGACVLRTLLTLANGEPVILDVASTNTRALRLYEKNGFIKTEEVRRWYCVPHEQED